MPSFDDNLDHTDDELLDPIPITKSSKKRPKADDMNFIAEHFGDSTDSDEDTLIKDLNFPDLNETDNASGSNMVSTAGTFVSQTLTSMMGSALSGISKIKPNIMSKSSKGDNPDGQSEVLYSKGNAGDDVVIQSSAKDSGNEGPADVQRVSVESSDLDITEEFDFLDEYEINDTK